MAYKAYGKFEQLRKCQIVCFKKLTNMTKMKIAAQLAFYNNFERGQTTNIT